MRKTLFIFCAAGALSACSSLPQTELPSSQTFQVEWIGERPLIDRSMLTVTLVDGERAAGLAGCNHWTANYQRAGQQLRFNNIANTRKLCAPALMEQEQRFLAYLARIQHWEFAEHGQLWLSAPDSAPLKLWPIQALPE